MQIGPETTHKQKGQSLVEFAISFTVIMLLLAGIVDLGRALFYWLALRDAAQEAAVYASICPTNLTEIEKRAVTSSHAPVDFAVEPHSTNMNLQCTYISTGALCGTGAAPAIGSGVRVTITYNNFPLMMPFIGTILGSQTLTLKATVEDTILRLDCPLPPPPPPSP